MGRFVKSPKDVVTGLMLVGVAAMFAILTRELPMGSAIRMGPGYFPPVCSGFWG